MEKKVKMKLTLEERELLLRDLFARVPYGVKVHVVGDGFYDEREPYDTELTVKSHCLLGDMRTDGSLDVRPYLRPLDDMTDDERKVLEEKNLCIAVCTEAVMTTADGFRWLNEKKFDLNGLIPLGLAYVAPKNMYKL